MLFDHWNQSQRTEDKWDKGKLGNSVMLDGPLELRIGPAFIQLVMRMLTFSKAKQKPLWRV
jgi:hypothetical protein